MRLRFVIYAHLRLSLIISVPGALRDDPNTCEGGKRRLGEVAATHLQIVVSGQYSFTLLFELYFLLGL